MERLEETYLSSQWFNKYCASHGQKIVNPQTLQDIRRKFCHSRVNEIFYTILKSTLHDNYHLIYNVDETSCFCDKKSKIVIHKGKYLPFVGKYLLDQVIGYITAVLCCNAAGETLMSLMILLSLLNLLPELNPEACVNILANIFLIWVIFFTHEVKEKRKRLFQIQGNKALTQPCFFILDGHKSHINSIALEIFASSTQFTYHSAIRCWISQPI